MQLQMLVNPTSAAELAKYWVPLLSEAEGVPLADLDDGRPPVGAVGTYLWVRRGSDGRNEEVLYAGSGDVRDRINRERRKILAATNLQRDGIEVNYVLTDGPAIASLVEILAIEQLRPRWQRTGFGSNHPGPTRAGQRRCSWDTDHRP